MFVHYNLEDLKTRVQLAERVQMEDLVVIIECFETEDYLVSDWELFEVATTDEYRIYGFQNGVEDVYMKIRNGKNAAPCYFQNHSSYGYSLYEADSIEEAMRLHEKAYAPH